MLIQEFPKRQKIMPTSDLLILFMLEGFKSLDNAMKFLYLIIYIP
ncbi:hypothetical protein V757_02465 [Pelistega indica]|uniref:Uncharacterized protein n=1 Tax=Pelistega indica TaxID=1414851 RepID=V8G8I6_9BURK|nr:hypothetical protein V757_02465 [Pelistega indica]